MKIKLVVVDLEIPPHIKKWGLRIGVCGGVLLGAAVALAGPLHVWAAGDTLTAMDLNGNFTTLQAQITTLQAQITSWQAYPAVLHTGTSSSPVTNQTTTAFWRRVGDTIELDIKTIMSDVPMSPDSGYWVWSLPTVSGSQLVWDDTKGSGHGILRVYTHDGTSVAGFSFADLGLLGGIAANCAGLSGYLPSVTGVPAFAAGDAIILHLSVPIVGW